MLRQLKPQTRFVRPLTCVTAFQFSSKKEPPKDKYYEKYKWISKTYRPYNYEVNYREVDQNLPIFQRCYDRTRYTLDDTRNFFVDILSGNQNAIMFKTSEFIKRKLKRTKARIYMVERAIVWLINVIRDGIHHTIHGLKDFGRDSKWLIQTKTQK